MLWMQETWINNLHYPFQRLVHYHISSYERTQKDQLHRVSSSPYWAWRHDKGCCLPCKMTLQSITNFSRVNRYAKQDWNNAYVTQFFTAHNSRWHMITKRDSLSKPYFQNSRSEKQQRQWNSQLCLDTSRRKHERKKQIENNHCCVV